MGDGSWVGIGWGWVAGWNDSGWPASTQARSVASFVVDILVEQASCCQLAVVHKDLFVMTRGMSEPSVGWRYEAIDCFVKQSIASPTACVESLTMVRQHL